jgi:hypothetical protein
VKTHVQLLVQVFDLCELFEEFVESGSNAVQKFVKRGHVSFFQSSQLSVICQILQYLG